MNKLNRVIYLAYLAGLTIAITLIFMEQTKAQQDTGFLHPPYFGTTNTTTRF